MNSKSRFLAFDLGAESGRAMAGFLDKGKLRLEEIYRFINEPGRVHNVLYWDVLRLFMEIKKGLKAYVCKCGKDLDSIAVDTWGVDFGLLSEDGSLISNPVHYRDHRTDGMMEKVFKTVPRDEIYRQTGIQFLSFNTIYQLFAMKQKKSSVLKHAKTLLMIPDLLHYFLTGIKKIEFSIATTSQMYNPIKREWAVDLLQRLDLPIHIFPEIIKPGTAIGSLLPEISRETGLEKVYVVAPVSHDTGSAVAAVPAEGNSWAYISCGTWSVLGAELSQPNISHEALIHNFTNEGGAEGTLRFLKNIMGLWVLQECRRQWQREGQDYPYTELVEMAARSKPFSSLINIDNPLFLNPDNMLEAINKHLLQTGQRSLTDKGTLVRIILEGIAFRYRAVLEELETLMKKTIDTVHIVGGGIKNRLLCQFTANATGRKVISGPAEATAIGNVMLQAIALGKCSSLQEARSIIRRSFETTVYEPEDQDLWDKKYKEMQKIYSKRKKS